MRRISSLTREEKIDCGKRIIEQIKMQNLREVIDTKGFLGKQSKDVQIALNNILDRIKKETENNGSMFKKIKGKDSLNILWTPRWTTDKNIYDYTKQKWLDKKISPNEFRQLKARLQAGEK